MHLVQLSDLHIRPEGALSFDRIDTAAYLARCIEAVHRLTPRPDLAVLSGDLVDEGSVDEYRHLRALLGELRMPYFLMAGNHDEHGALRAVFSDHSYLPADGFLHYALTAGPLDLIMLDTVAPGNAWGILDAERLEWLERSLRSAPAKPAFIFMHHPPFPTGIAGMDDIGCRGAQELAALLRRHPRVTRISCGHVHRLIFLQWAGVSACVAPSTAHQLELDLGSDGARAPHFVLEPPGFLLHAWSRQRGLITHYHPVGEFPGPFPFHMEDARR